MAGRVDEVQHVDFAVIRLVMQAHGLGLDGDAALTLDIHIVQHLLGHIALGKTTRRLDQPVGKGGFAMVDMGDDGEVADMVEGCAGRIGAHAPRYRGFRGQMEAVLWRQAAAKSAFQPGNCSLQSRRVATCPCVRRRATSARSISTMRSVLSLTASFSLSATMPLAGMP